MKIKALMTAEVACVQPQYKLEDAVAQMSKHGYSCLVVTQENLPIGIITERDLVRVFSDHFQDEDLRKLTVEDFMSTPPVVVKESATIDEVITLTESKRIRHFPVVDENGQLVGIVTQTDLARSYQHTVEQKVTERTEQLALAHQQLLEQQAALHAEGVIARHVYDQLTARDKKSSQGLSVWSKAVGSFNGDVVLADTSAEGKQHVLLGDFTGHGLSAALGVIPSAPLFHTMTEKSLGMQAIEQEMNDKLTTLLPVGNFCCVCLIEIDADRKQAHLCNRGLPPIYIIGGNGKIRHRVESSGIPLGITRSTDNASAWQSIPLAQDDCLYAYTDGLTELTNPEGKEFGTARLERLLTKKGSRNRLNEVESAALAFLGESKAIDDLTMIELCV